MGSQRRKTWGNVSPLQRRLASTCVHFIEVNNKHLVIRRYDPVLINVDHLSRTVFVFSLVTAFKFL